MSKEEMTTNVIYTLIDNENHESHTSEKRRTSRPDFLKRDTRYRDGRIIAMIDFLKAHHVKCVDPSSEWPSANWLH